MRTSKKYKKVWVVKVLLALLTYHLSLIPSTAQDISQIAKSDPLVMSGAIGTSNTYYHSTGYRFASPFQSSVWANLNLSVYGISMPFSLYYTNSDFNFNYPHISLNLSPRYKQWQAYFGQSSMSYSPYVMNMSFNGVGVEYQGERLRFGLFYGRLRNAINDDPTDLSARLPQYRRSAWGVKVGYGTQKHYLDLYFLRAFDSEKSISEHWRQQVNPQENLVVGLRGYTRLTNWLSLSANAATSLITTDTRARRVESDKLDGWDKVFDARYTSNMRFAGDASVNLTLRGLNAAVSYRMVQPDYTSLGTYYMSNNYQSLALTASTRLFRRIALSGNFSLQSDNLSNKQLYTTRGYVYSASASSRIGKVMVSARYNGYLQRQYDGTARVNDTTRVSRIMHSIGASASYSFQTEELTHSFSLSAAMNQNKDLNKFATGETDVKTISGGASYNVNVEPWQTDFTTTLNHQQSRGYSTKYTSDVLALTAARSFLHEQNLRLQATLTLCYNKMQHVRENMSLGGDMQVGYTLNNVHTFALNGGIARSNDVNIIEGQDMYNVTELNVGLSYTYTFSLFEIKRKSATPTTN